METKEKTVYVLTCGEGEILATFAHYFSAHKKMVELEKKRYARNPHYYDKMKQKYYRFTPGMPTDVLEVLINTAYELGNTYYDIIPTTLWEEDNE